jgi:hypothetical protein
LAKVKHRTIHSHFSIKSLKKIFGSPGYVTYLV